MGISFVQARTGGSVQVIERELSSEFTERWINDALDEHDPKEFSVLHERDAETADGKHKEVNVMSKPSIQVVSPDNPDFKPLFDFYVQFFPKIERNTYESLCGYYGKADGIYEYESIVCKEDGKIVGGCYVNLFKDIHVCFIEFIFVD